MTPTAIEIGGLALIVGMFALAQRLGGWEHRPLARCLGIAAAGLFAAWCFLFFPGWVGWAVTATLWSVCLWFIFTWVHKPEGTIDAGSAGSPPIIGLALTDTPQSKHEPKPNPERSEQPADIQPQPNLKAEVLRVTMVLSQEIDKRDEKIRELKEQQAEAEKRRQQAETVWQLKVGAREIKHR